MISKTKFLNTLYRRTVDIYNKKVRYLNKKTFTNFSYNDNNTGIVTEKVENVTQYSGTSGGDKYNKLFPDGNDYIIDEDPDRTFYIKNESDPTQNGTVFGTTNDYDEEGSQYIGLFSDAETVVIASETFNKPDHNRSIYVVKKDKNGDHVWTKDLNLKGTSGTSLNRINSINCDRDGNIYVSGYFAGKMGDEDINVTRTPIQANAFTLKMDYDGNIKWIKHVDYDNGEKYTEVVATAYNKHHVYLNVYFGYTSNNFYFDGKKIDLSVLQNTGTMDRTNMIIKVNNAGKYVDHVIFDTDNMVNVRTITYENDNLYIGGFLRDNGFFGNGVDITNTGTALMLLKLDKNLKTQFAKIGSGIDSGQISDIKTDENDNIYINGFFDGALSLDGSTNHDYSTTVNSVIAAKYDSDGNVLWSYNTTNTGQNLGYGIYEINGNIALMNEYSGNGDFEIDNKGTSQLITDPYNGERYNVLVILNKDTGEYLDKFTYLFPIRILANSCCIVDPDNNLYITGYNEDINTTINLTIGVDSDSYAVDGFTSLTHGKICSKALDI